MDWKASSDEYLSLRDAQRKADLAEEMKAHEARISLAEYEAQLRMEIEQQRADASAQIHDALLSSHFNLISAHNHADTELALSTLNRKREQELANEDLTESQKHEINERYRKEESKIKKESFIRQKKADVIQAVINTALAISRALPDPIRASLAGVLGAIQVATIAAQPVPQFYKGRYPVKGLSDGKTYLAHMAGVPVTGIYKQPALVAEKGDELIVDSPTTRNIRLNYPHLLSAIMAARVPQYASGRYPEKVTPSQAHQETIGQGHPSFDFQKLAYAIDRLNENSEKMLNEGIRGVWVYYDFLKIKSKVDAIERDTSL